MKIEIRNTADMKQKEIAVDKNLEKFLNDFLIDFLFENFELFEE